MGRITYASLGFQQRRVRLTLTKTTWVRVEDAADACGLSVTELLNYVVGRAVEDWAEGVPMPHVELGYADRQLSAARKGNGA